MRPEVSHARFSADSKPTPPHCDFRLRLAAIEQTDSMRAVLKRPRPDLQIAVFGDTGGLFAEAVLINGDQFAVL